MTLHRALGAPVLLWACLTTTGHSQAASPQASGVVSEPARYQAVVDRYCVGCHNERLKTANLTLDTLDLIDVHPNADQWEKVVRKLRMGMMPPVGQPRPDRATSQSMVAYLEAALDRTAGKEPGRSRGLHRLNRAEYANAIRDLLAVEVDVTALLPPDDSSFGFDNIADVLGVSPALQERYLHAATKISALAVGDVAQLASSDEETLVIPADLTQTQHQDGLPYGTRGGRVFHKHFPLDADYQFKVKLFRASFGDMRGLEFPSRLIVLLDGRQVFENIVGGAQDSEAARANPTGGADAVDNRLQFKIPVTAGPHDLAVTFVQKTQAEPPTTLQPLLATLDQLDVDGISKIDQVKILGPFDPTGPGDTPSRRRIFTCRPARKQDEGPCARTILSTLARRAYRRPIARRDTQSVMSFYERGRREGTFDSAVGLALSYILANPEFVFRVERDPADLPPDSVYPLTDLAIASRLSFFLWSSIPDDQLLTMAERGWLRKPAVLQQQVTRMLADPKAIALTKNFAGQWLWIRNLNNVAPNYNEFPEFDRNLRDAMRTETEMLFKSIIDEDRNVTDLLGADYTFLNERLAKHYGISTVYGSQLRRVKLTDPNRFGLLGHGSVLTVTSNPDRTSPVHRGRWVLENLLGTPPPMPPPGVDTTLKPEAAARPKTLREEMEAHRTNPVCAACHRLMDPIGFALDNFDGIGQWRTAYPGSPSSRGTPIDASGQLASGAPIDGPASLRQALLSEPEHFVRTMTEKMLTYALGRGLDYYDMPAVRRIVRDAAKNNYRFSSLVMGVVTSTPFQMRMKTPPAADTKAVQ